MSPAALLAGLLWVIMVLLALSAPTAALDVVAYGLFCAVVMVGAGTEAWQGRPTRTRRWGLVHLVASVFLVASLDLAGRVRGPSAWHWGPPFLFVLAVGWIPPVWAFGLASVARGRGEARSRKVVRERRTLLAAREEP